MISGQAGRFLIQSAGLVVLAHILSPTDYGRYAQIIAIVGVATLLSDGGLSLAAIRAGKLTQQQRTNLFWVNAAVGLGLAAITLVLAYPVAALYGDASLIALTQGLAPLFVLSGVQVQLRAHVNAQLRFSRLVAADLSGALLGLLAAVVAGLLGAGSWALVIQQLVTAGVALIVIAVAARWVPSLPRRTEDMARLYAFGVNSLANQVLNYLSTNVPSIVLGRVGGAASLGYYNRAYTLFTLPMTQLAAPMTRVALPVISRDLEPRRLLQRLVVAQTVLCWVLVGVFALVAGTSGPLIGLVFGARWSFSAPIFQVLAVGGAFQAMAYVYYWAFLATAQTRAQLRVVAPARILMIALAFPLAAFGGVGIAWALTIGLVAIWLLSATVGMRRIGLLRMPLLLAAARPFAVYAVVVAVQLVTLSWLHAWPDVVQVLIGGAELVAVVGLAAALIRPVRGDLTLVVSVLRSVLKRG